ncbi:hypothetical protein ABIB99_004931 [Bradyrhizobium sp. LA6.1]
MTRAAADERTVTFNPADYTGERLREPDQVDLGPNQVAGFGDATSIGA